MNVKELKASLRTLGLPVTGAKAVLQQRLDDFLTENLPVSFDFGSNGQSSISTDHSACSSPTRPAVFTTVPETDINSRCSSSLFSYSSSNLETSGIFPKDMSVDFSNIREEEVLVENKVSWTPSNEQFGLVQQSGAEAGSTTESSSYATLYPHFYSANSFDHEITSCTASGGDDFVKPSRYPLSVNDGDLCVSGADESSRLESVIDSVIGGTAKTTCEELLLGTLHGNLNEFEENPRIEQDGLNQHSLDFLPATPLKLDQLSDDIGPPVTFDLNHDRDEDDCSEVEVDCFDDEVEEDRTVASDEESSISGVVPKKPRYGTKTEKVDLSKLWSHFPNSQFLLSSKGRPRIQKGNALYRSYNFSKKEQKMVWRCTDNKCSGKLIEEQNDFRIKFACTVNHPPPDDKVLLTIALNRAKALYLQHNDVQSACDTVFRESDNRTLAVLPDPAKFGKMIRTAVGRNKGSSGVYPVRSTDEDSRLMFEGKNVVIYNDTNSCPQPDGILILATEFGLDSWEKGGSILFGDGQFKRERVVKGFSQCYSFGVIREAKFIVVFSVFLCSKSRGCYTKAFNIMRSFVDFRKIEYLSLDFELAAILAGGVFPNAQISLCFFHYSQALWNQASEKGVGEPEYRQWIKLFKNLAFLPHKQIAEAYKELADSINSQPNLREAFREFLRYMEFTYVGFYENGQWKDPRFRPEWWSVYDRVMNDIPITNNFTEIFHATFGRNCKRATDVFGYVRVLKGLWERHRHDRRRMKLQNALPLGEAMPPPTELSLFAKEVLNSSLGNGTLIDVLRGISKFSPKKA